MLSLQLLPVITNVLRADLQNSQQARVGLPAPAPLLLAMAAPTLQRLRLFDPQSHAWFKSLYFFETASLFQHHVSPGSQGWLQLHEMNSNVDCVKHMSLRKDRPFSVDMQQRSNIKMGSIPFHSEEKKEGLLFILKIINNILYFLLKCQEIEPLLCKCSVVELLRIIYMICAHICIVGSISSYTLMYLNDLT